ncbi:MULTISPECIES: type II toxin-antitoxin system RatA family toxin [Hydrocarboniphaga]|jgi:ribosome-associated toxin RatA of RatAB toxin-antitoxin module|uniref:type II toxin-antitoxin system RatA family toxin n=1 Tax=Hydrocarboniphaga TaxID=243627 RepID=UPI002ABBE773|nr:type II toxin-antitoxin system RatA family toxin [Hydrocarboniphaga sp.]MDZ4077323.1 type II toxin-antitoxin system RatA family toxin [Hydrocarboniphaga sp.]
MRKLDRSALMPFSAAELYALVADVASYPQFLPGCTSADVEQDEQREGERWVKGRVSFKVKGLSDSFATENRMLDGQRIEMRLLEGPFRSLSGVWVFTPLAEQACKVSLSMSVDFASRLVEATLAPWIDRAVGGVIDAFRLRAEQCYKR